MVNPVKQNAGQIPLSTQNFFENDGKTISAPWRAFLRNMSQAVGVPGGGGDLPGLIEQVKEQGQQLDALFALEGSTASAITIGALIARIGTLEQSAVATVPVIQAAIQRVIDLVPTQRAAMAAQEAAAPIPARPSATLDQVFQIPVFGSVSTAAPAAGGAGALPATPAGYETRLIGGVPRKVAFY